MRGPQSENRNHCPIIADKNVKVKISYCLIPSLSFAALTFPDLKKNKLENVFMKHYAPNHIPDPKGEWTLKENNSELHHGIYSKVNQLIYTLICNYMPNIRILAKAVRKIFCSQGCSYTKCLCPENESNSSESLRNVLKS